MVKHYYVIGAITIFMFVAVSYGFSIGASPWAARDRKTDQVTTYNIQAIVPEISSYFSTYKKLPEKLTDLPQQYIRDRIIDPQTGKQYEYQVTGGSSYKLCANFKTDSKDSPNNYYSSSVEYNFNHPKGYFCFDRNAQGAYSQNYTPYPTSSPVPTPTSKPAQLTILSTCTDSDADNPAGDTYVKGVVTVKGYGTTSLTDNCTGDHTLTEYYCQESPVNSKNFTFQSSLRDCPKGCVNGACTK